MTSSLAMASPSIITSWLNDVERATRDLKDCGQLIRSGDFSEFRSRMSKNLKVLGTYAHDLNETKTLQRKTDSIVRMQVIDGTDASFQLEQAISLADDVCKVLANVSTSLAFLYAMDGGFMATREHKTDMLLELMDYSNASSDGGVLKTVKTLKAYLANVKAVSDSADVPYAASLFSTRAVVEAKLQSSGLMRIFDTVPVVAPGDQGELKAEPTGAVSGSQAGRWTLPVGDETKSEANGVLGAGGPPLTSFIAQVHRRRLNDAAVVVTAHQTNVTNVPLFTNRSGRSMNVTLSAKIFGIVSGRDNRNAAYLASTVNPRTLASITGAQFIKLNGVAQTGYKAANAGPNSDTYVYFVTVPADGVLSIDTPDVSAATAAFYSLIRTNSQIDVDPNERTFADLVGLGSPEAFALLRRMFTGVDYSLIHEYNSYLYESFGVDKLTSLGALTGVANWRILFSSDYWASADTVSVQEKRRKAAQFAKSLITVIRLILSDCQFLDWYSS